MTTNSAITIGEFVDNLEHDYDPQDFINIGALIGGYIQVNKDKDNKYSFHERYSQEEKWNCLRLTNETSIVSDVLETLKVYVPGHKNKSVCIFNAKTGSYNIILNNIKQVKMCKIEASDGIVDFPQIKLEESTLAWKKFEDDIAKFKEHVPTAVSFFPIAQLAIMKNPEIGQILCVGNTFYHTYEDVKNAYPELTESQDDQDLFEDFAGVKACKVSESELTQLCSDRKNPKYVTANGEFTKDELLQKYNITETQIDKLFYSWNSKFVCKIPVVLTELQK